MSEQSSQVTRPQGLVGAVLVSHDGATWLPAVLDGLAAQTHPVDRVVAVDTGSSDASPELLSTALGAGAVLAEPPTTSFPQAVARGLERLDKLGDVDGDLEWVWLLHDDANPDPGALEALLAAAAAHPEADVLGPKLREWPSLRRLLEVGVTISGTGRRETGLERGEYDQGQHDEVRAVLAVNTAGMLVRRRLLEELGGFDERLPIFGNDLDFGWRAARAGHTTLVVPQAVVFHAEAAHRGLRKTELTGRHRHLAERTAALYTLLANCKASLLPFQYLRLILGSMLRVLGFLVVRSPGEAGDELAAVASVCLRPGAVLAARKERSPLAANDDRVRGLLAPRWLPYRHGLDAISDVAAAATNQAADVAERRRAAKLAELSEHGAHSEDAPPRTEEDELSDDIGILARFLTDPIALVMTAYVVLLLWAGHTALGASSLTAAGLSPAPETTGHWWALYTDAWHPLAQGSDVAAPAYVLPLALLATVIFGHATGAIALVLLLAAPLATWGAWRLLRVLGRFAGNAPMPRWVLAVGVMTYGLVPIGTGAWAQGRLGTVVAAAVLPWLVHAALGFADPTADRRWRAAWRTTLLLSLVAAFAPVAWVYVAVLTLLLLVAAAVFTRGLLRDRSITLPLVTPALATPVLLLPWFGPMLFGGHAEALLMEAGRLPGPLAGAADLAASRLAGLAAPHWVGWLLAVLAIVSLLPRRSRTGVTIAWGLAALAALLAAALSRLVLGLPGGEVRPSPGFLVLVLAGAAVVAVTLGLQQLWRDASSGGVPVLALLLAAALVPVGGLAWALFSGDHEVQRDSETEIPAYMTQQAELSPDNGVLVVDGSVATGLTYSVVRGAGVTTGEDEILAHTDVDPALSKDLSRLFSQPTPAVVQVLADDGIEYVVLPAPADGRVAAGLDATAGLEQASAPDADTRAWQLAPQPGSTDLAGHGSWQRWVLLTLQALALLGAAVLCGPSRTSDRRASEEESR